MPSTELWTNNARSTLSAGISAGALSVVLATGEGARFPNPSANQYFWVTMIDSLGNYEIVKVTARSSDTLTIVRAQQGSSARSFDAGDVVSLRPTRMTFERFVQKDGDETISGTLTVPTPTNAGHAATKAYVDLRLPLTGGTLSGTLTVSTSGFGVNATSSGTHGVRGQSTDVNAGGVIGLGADGSRYGILGLGNTFSVYGVGRMFNTSPDFYGIEGRTSSAGHGGVVGYTQNGSIFGILGYNNTWSFHGNGPVSCTDVTTSAGSVNARLAALEAAVAALGSGGGGGGGDGD